MLTQILRFLKQEKGFLRKKHSCSDYLKKTVCNTLVNFQYTSFTLSEIIQA